MMMPSGSIPCSKQYSSQQELPIWTPAWPMWTEIHSLCTGMGEKRRLGMRTEELDRSWHIRVSIEHVANNLRTRAALAQLGGSQDIFSTAGSQELLNKQQLSIRPSERYCNLPPRQIQRSGHHSRSLCIPALINTLLNSPVPRSRPPSPAAHGFFSLLLILPWGRRQGTDSLPRYFTWCSQLGRRRE